jgi:hypothetical protein
MPPSWPSTRRGCQAWFHLAPDDKDLLEIPARCASF